MALMANEYVKDLSASALDPLSLNINAAGISGSLLPEMAAIRSQMADLRTLLGVWAEPGGADRVRRRCQPGSPTVIEQVIYLRDLLHATADRLERLVVDAHPVQIAVASCEPTAGYHRWSPEALLPIVAAETDRLTRLTQEMATTDELSPRTRQGLQTITKELLGSAFGDGEQHIRQAERSIESSSRPWLLSRRRPPSKVLREDPRRKNRVPAHRGSRTVGHPDGCLMAWRWKWRRRSEVHGCRLERRGSARRVGAEERGRPRLGIA
jgi:hypothetical protein